MTHLQVRNLSKSFDGLPVLTDVTLEVESGQVLAILGSSGSGKTTLLRLICGFERTDSGSIVIDGRIVADARTHLRPEQRQVGYVPQEGALFPHLSVADNIVFGLPRRQRRTHHRVAELLELVGLPAAFAARPPQALSGGEQQRIALARALAPAPQLVLLDEPFSALDATLRTETRAAVAVALAAAGATALLVTHDQAEALSMGNNVAVLQHGRVAQVSDPITLYMHPSNAELARFVGDAVVLPGIIHDGEVTCALGTFASAAPQDGPVEVMIRPEQIQLSGAASGVPAQVIDVVYYGADAAVRLKVSHAENQPIVTARVAGYAAPKPGVNVNLAVVGEVVIFSKTSDPIACSRGDAAESIS